MLRIFGLLDILIFLLFIPSKAAFLIDTFSLPFSAEQKVGAIWQVLVLFFFLFTGILLFQQKKSGFILSFISILFRFTFLYFSFDFLSYLAYHLGFDLLVANASFQDGWFYLLIVMEVSRYVYSFYAFQQISKA